MARYSEVVETNGRTIRYNYESCRVEWFQPATEEELNEDARFRNEHPDLPYGLYDFDDNNNIIVKTFRCDLDEWEDLSIRNELLCEFNRMADEFLLFVDAFSNFVDTAQ